MVSENVKKSVSKRVRRKPEVWLVRGRIATGYLARGQVVRVTVTEDLKRLVAEGYVERLS